MRTIRRLLALVAALAVVLAAPAALAPAPAVADVGSAPSPVHVIETDAHGTWAGGIARLKDGRFYVVYMRGYGKGVPAHVFGRTISNLLAPTGKAHWLAGGPKTGYLDPGVVRTRKGTYLLSMHSKGSGIRLAGLSPSKNRLTTAIHNITGNGYNEATIGRWFGKVQLAYNSLSGGDYGKHVLVRQVYGPTSVAAATRGICCSGDGPAGSQDRDTIARTGAPGSMILTWSRPSSPGGANRTIYAALSGNRGASWGAPFQIAADPDADLVNPFAIRVGGEVRVYIEAKTDSGRRLEVVTSQDAGHTWTAPTVVPVDPSIHGIGRPVFIVQKGVVVCFASWVGKDGRYVLGTFSVP
ncbi:MAG TPA: exo-alpha-sialidase [Actinomycetota bacterium]